MKIREQPKQQLKLHVTGDEVNLIRRAVKAGEPIAITFRSPTDGEFTIELKSSMQRLQGKVLTEEKAN